MSPKKNPEVMLQLEDLTKSYYLANGEEIPILKGVSLKVHKGEFVALMGESGGGKSTLLNIIGFLHPLTKGKYFLEGEEISGLKDDDALAFLRNRKIGFIFQSFHLLSKMSALKNVALPGLYKQIPAEEREKRATEILTEVGLGDRIHHKPNELSGGQQQRVAVARSLMNNPEILLADEPTGALDHQTGEEIMQMFLNFKKQGKTIIMVTHTPDIARYADRIIFMREGKVVDCDYKV